MGNRIGDLEESISLIRNLNLDLMVTPERLEDKMHLLQQQMTSLSDRETNRLENQIHIKAKDIHEYCSQLIRERVGKKDFKDVEAFLLNLIRENKTVGKQSEAQLNALQTKYANLETWLVTHDQMQRFEDEHEKYKQETRDKIAELEAALSMQE